MTRGSRGGGGRGDKRKGVIGERWSWRFMLVCLLKQEVLDTLCNTVASLATNRVLSLKVSQEKCLDQPGVASFSQYFALLTKMNKKEK